MRENHDGLPEIREAYEDRGQYFAVIQVEVEGTVAAFEARLDALAYGTIRRVLQFRPFEAMPGCEYRYYFVPSVYQVPESDAVEFTVRIEQGPKGKQFRFQGPRHLVAGLMWYFNLDDLSLAADMKRVQPRLES
jgi:hypothetical protein